MSVTIHYTNNYDKFKEDFKKDTGLDADKDKNSYITYYNARINDMNYQLNFQTTNLILNHIDFLPGKISLSIAEMIKTHYTIKDLILELKKRP